MHNSKVKQLKLAVLLAFLPVVVNAAGLGKLTVNSGLGEPLSAEIELVSTTPEEMSSISASIASEEAYVAQGLEKSSIHGAIRVEVSKRGQTPVLKLSSNQAITDPFLDMLIQVDWATGRLVREYTVLLDPPGYNTAQTTPTSVKVPEVKVASVTRYSPASTASQSAKASTAPVESGEYQTQKGDTLGKVAKELRVQDVSLDQMLVGLYRANKDAFINDNMNRLKVGQIIKVPTATELQSISAEEAKSEIRAHSSDWNSYRQKLAQAVTEENAADKPTATSNASSSSQAVKGKITAATDEKALPPSSEPKDVVKLSKGDADKKAADASNVQAMKDKLNALQEEGVAREKSVKEASDRVSALEKQVSDLQKLLAMKDQTLSQLQKNAEAAAKKPAEVTPPEAPKPVPEPVKASPVVEENPAQTPPPPVAVVEEKKPEAAVKSPEPVKPEPTKEVTPPAPVAEEPSMSESIMSAIDPVLVGGGLGGIALLVAGWTFLRNKRRRNLDNFEKGILTAGGLKANTVFGNTAGGTVDTGDTSFLTDFSQSINGMIDTHDVDPIAEAEVYMAYGREAQAEEILNDAITKDPTRYELHLKLLEIYSGRSDVSAFEAISGELYSTLGAAHPVWAKVAEMGRKMEPDNPLYDLSETTAATLAFNAAEAGTANLVSAKSELRSESPLEDSSFETLDLNSEENSLDFTLDDAPTTEVEVASEEDVALDFDFAASETEIPNAPDETNALEASNNLEVVEEDLESALEFDISSLDTTAPAVDEVLTLPEGEDSAQDMGLDFPLDDAPQEPVAVDPLEDASEMSFDLGMPDAPTELTSQEPEFVVPELSLPSVDEIVEPEILAESESIALDFELPSLDAAASPENDLQVLPDIGLDFPEVATPDTIEPESTLADSPVDFGLDLPTESELSTEAPELVIEDASEISLSDMDLPSLDLDTSMDDTQVLDLSSDNPLPVLDDAVNTAIESSEAQDAPVVDLDLSEINLDITEPEAVEEISFSADVSESEDVNTKLDLVSAYMEMGDQEGARELLEEVIQEGGPTQKAKAEKLLAELM